MNVNEDTLIINTDLQTDLISAKTGTAITIAGITIDNAISASDITGTLADTNISASSVTQHTGSIDINNLLNSPSGTIVGISDTQVLTNKTIDSSTNVVTADKIRTTTGTVTMTSTAPTAGQTLIATNGTTASWQNKFTLDVQKVTTDITTSTTSTTYVDLDSLTLNTVNTVPSTYVICFSCVFFQSGGNNSMNSFIINVNGVDQTSSERTLNVKTSNTDYLIVINDVITNIGNNITIKIRYKTSTNTLSVFSRTLIIYGVY